ncbi:MAG: cytidine deaminase [Schleiferiaceae bacterium]|jgi:cytidine deaminase|nr:cytidine deaminase [Schleiferiaceae bacterium]
MIHKKETFEYIVHDSIESVSEEHKELIAKAVENREQAYAPYSGFYVGSSVLLANGEIVTGSNQENAAYPSGLCAERVALFSAGATYPNEIIKALVVTCRNTKKLTDQPFSSCGACRQVMLEYELKQDEDIIVYYLGEQGPIIQVNAVKDLMPLHFPPDAL